MTKKDLCIFSILMTILILFLVSIGVYIRYNYWYASKLYHAIHDNAYAKNNEEIDKLLRQNGNINSYNAPIFLYKILSVANAAVETPLTTACHHNNYEAVKRLLEKGADPNKFLEGGWSPMEATLVCPNYPKDRSFDKLEILKLLLEYGADVDSRGSRETALFRTLNYYDNEYALEIVKTLIDAGAKMTNDYNKSILNQACIYGSHEMIQYLIEERGLDLNHQDNFGLTPLMEAILHKNLPFSTIEYLIAQGSDINIKDSKGKTALDYAKERGDMVGEQIVDLLERVRAINDSE